MALNVQWRFQQPIEFKHINDRTNANKEGVRGAVQLGIGIHDYLLDRDAANLMEGQAKQGEIDAQNQEQMNKEISLIESQIQTLKQRNEEIKNEINSLQSQKTQETQPNENVEGVA